MFLKLKRLLKPFGITRYHTDAWGAYTHHLDPDEHHSGKRNTQQDDLFFQIDPEA
jgi:insertion element IS1 protein InsB